MAVNRDLSKFANHIFNHEDGGIGLSTDTNTRIGIGTDVPRAKLDVHGDLHVSGIATFKDSIDANILDVDSLSGDSLQFETVSVASTFTAKTLQIHPTSVEYQGSLVGIFTDTITNIATDGIEVNYEVVGDRLNFDTVVSSIGSSSVTLSQTTTNNIILVQEDGIFESSNGNLIVGIDTSNAVIGYGISNQYITQGTTISSVGLSSITISQAASNPASKLVKTGELTGIATNSITGINTSGIFENQLVFGEFIDSQTGISSIGQGEIFLTKNTTNSGLHTGSFDIYFIDQFEIFSQQALFTGNYQFVKSNTGIATIYHLNGTKLDYANGDVNSLTGSHLRYTGISTFDSDLVINGAVQISGDINTGILSTSDAFLQSLTADNIIANNIHTVELMSATSGIVTSLAGTDLTYTGVGTITNIEGETLNITGLSSLSVLGISTINATEINTDVITTEIINVNQAIQLTELSTGIVTATLLDAENLTAVNANITSLEGTNLNLTGISTFSDLMNTEDVLVNGSLTVPTGILSATDANITNLTAEQSQFTNLSVDVLNAAIGIVTELSGVNIEYSGIGTLTNIQGESINYTGLATFNDVGVTTLTGTTVRADYVIVDSDLQVLTGFISATTFQGNNLDIDNGDITNLDGQNLNYSGLGTITTIDSNQVTANNIEVTNINSTGIATFNDAEFQDINSSSITVTTGIVTTLSGESLSFSNATIGNVKLGIGTDLIVDGNARVTGILTVGSGSITINGNNDQIVGVETFNSNTGIITTLSGTSATYSSATLDALNIAGINTSTGVDNLINIQASNSAFSTSYNLTLPPYLGIPGQVLQLQEDGTLGFSTAGLYENRIYVSPENGDDSNDGKSLPVKSIRRAAQLASFESFVLPGSRYADAGNLLLLNRSYIAKEVVGFVTATHPGLLSNPDYDPLKCERDTGLIVDALYYDLTYGGNSKTVEAGLSYYTDGGTSYVAGESTETISAFRHIITIGQYIINNVGVPTSYQPSIGAEVFQSFDLNISYDANCGTGNSYSANCCADVFSAVTNYVGIVTTIIGIGTGSAPEISKPTSKSTPVAVFVEAGEYIEDNPILMYEDVAIIGDNLRNTIIRPLNAGKDLFRLRNGCYLTGFAMKDAVDAAGIPQFTFDNAVAYDDPLDTTVSRTGYAIKTEKPIITRSPYIQNCSILSFLGANGVLVDGSKVDTLNTPIVRQEGENPVEGEQPEQGKSMVAAAFTMVSFGGIGWRVINDGYSQVVSCFQIFCRYGSLAQSGGYLSITNSATNFGFFALRSTGFNFRSYIFDRGIVASTGTSDGLQTLKVVGLGRSDQELYVLKFFDHGLNDQTSNFKLASVVREVDIAVGVNTSTDTIGIQTHGFLTGDSIIYLGNENTIPKQVIGGLVNLNEYFAEYVNDDEFRLYEDDSLTRLVDLTSVTTGINTFIKGNREFFNFEKIDAHTSYQRITFAPATPNLTFITGREVTQTVNGGSAVGFAVTYNSTQKELLVSVEAPGGVRNNFGVTGVGLNLSIQDHSSSPVSAAATMTVGVGTFHTIEFKVDCTTPGSSILGISQLPENYRVHFHRPSIVNSSSHTWEYSGSGIDYNALPQNGGKTDTRTEQVFTQGGRVYSSGTNELGDFKIGNFITAFNRTGNIIFNNKVSIGQLDSLRLSLSGGVAVEEFSIDIGLGDNEIGGAQDFRVSTQRAVRTFLNNRLGNFIDKEISTNAVPSAVVQLNAFGQINADLIPPKVVNYFTADVDGGRTSLVDRIPAVNLKNGDTVVEPSESYVLVSDVYSQFLILDDNTRNYNFDNGDIVVSAVSDGGAIGVVTHPTSTGYGSTGLVKGVSLSASILSGGSGYTNPGIYTSVLLSNSVTGAGVSANATITVGASGTVTQCSIVYGGRYYSEGDTVSISNPNTIGGRSGGSEFQARIDNVETRLYIELTNNQKFTGSSILSDYISDGDAVGVSANLTNTYQVTFTPNSSATGGDIDFDNDRLIIGTNSFADGDPIVYSSGGGNVLSSLINNNTYYVKRVGISSIELYTTYALSSKLDLLSNGTGTHSLTRNTVNVATDQITIVNHGFTTGDAVRISGNTPTGITTGSFYFIGSLTTNSFSLHPTQSAALSAVNGLIFNPVNITAVGTGTLTLTKQNVEYSSTVNTSSSLPDNWTLLASGSVDAANITSGTVAPSRLGSGIANSDTFLGGDSVYRKATKSIGIESTAPLSLTGDSFEVDGSLTKYFGNVELDVERVTSTLTNFSTLGVAKFKTSTFSIGSDGAVSLKTSQTGDIDAASLGGFSASYYLNIANSTGSIPITRGGTGLSALPSSGAMLVGNGSAYTLTGSPTISGTLTGAISIPGGKDIVLTSGTWTGNKSCKIQHHSNNLYLQFTTNLIGRNSSGTNVMTLSSGGNLDITGEVRGSVLRSDVANGTAPFIVSSSTKVSNLNADLLDGLDSGSFLRSDTSDTATGTLTVRDIKFAAGYHLQRSDHHSGHLEGSYNNVGQNSTRSNPIYTIGSSYNPASTTLSNMYGIGYTHSNSSFISLTGASGWGMYVAADGDARIYLSGSNGTISSSGNHYVGSNRVLHVGDEGSGNGLDADTVDGIQGSSFLRSDANDNASGRITINGAISSGSSAFLQVRGFSRMGAIAMHQSSAPTSGDGVPETTHKWLTNISGVLRWGTNATTADSTIWHSGNDGSGSGLDADNLDGLTWNSSGKDLRGTEIYADNWFRNYNANEGLYNQATGAHWYSSADGYWELTGNTQNQSTNLRFRGTFNGNVEGWIHSNGAGWLGFLNAAGQWALRHYNVDGYSPNWYFDESGNETWTGNTGNDQGKIEYHSNRFYIVSGANSTEIARFRHSGTDRVVIQNSGNIQINGGNVWHSGNDGSGSGLDADLLDGLQLHTGRNNVANRVVRTDGNGYIQAGWINTTSGTSNRTLPNKFYGSNDDYLRYYTRDYTKAHLGNTYKYGNSRPNITSDSNYWVGTMGWGRVDMNSVFDYGSGFIDSWSNPGNQPSGTSHWVGTQALHYTNGSNRYGWQMVGGPITNLRFRSTWGGFRSWRTIPVLDENSTNGGAMYAGIYYDSNNTGYYSNPGDTSRMNQIQANTYYSPYPGSNSGLARSSYPYGWGFQESGGWSNPYPDLVLQYHTGVTMAGYQNYNGITFKSDYNNDTVRFRINGSSGYTYKYTWMYTNSTGYYSGDYSWHISPNDLSSYGSMRLRGSKSGWYGIAIDTGNRPHVMFDGSGNGGFYNQDGGRWAFYYSHGNNCVGITGSSTSSTYELYVSGDIYATGNINSASDARLKKNIKPLENALEKVLNLRGVNYEWDLEKAKNRKPGVKVGLIAQEVVEVVPEVVTYAEDADEYSVEYGNITALLIEAMKEQNEVINTLREEVLELKKKLGE